MNSLRSNSISYFVAQIACCNPRLNIASKNHTSYKCLLVRNVFEGAKRQSRLPHFVLHVFSNLILENIPHEEVFRGCTIIGIFFDSCIAKRDKQIDMRCCLSEASSWTSQAAKPSASNDYDNITSGLGDRTFSRRLFALLEKERKADGAVVGALDVGVDEGVGEVGTETIGDDEIINTPTGVLLTRLKTV